MAKTMQIHRSEYNAKKRHQYAGSKSALDLTPADVEEIKARQPDWKGMHWYMFNAGGAGTALAYVNVVPDNVEIAPEDAPPNLR